MTHLAGVPRVVFVTVQLGGTRPWEAQANGEIRAAAERYPNVVVADWKAASDGHPDYTRSDGIHLSPGGGGVYAATIAGPRSDPGGAIRPGRRAGRSPSAARGGAR